MHKIRKDVQGLRALAVISVVLFHFGIKMLPGGFVGVDVFFVISGFVITTGLIDRIDAGNFTFSEFYAKRAFRILPAIMVTCLVTTLVAWWLLLPPDFLDFARSLIAALCSASNFWFWKTSNYFAPESQSAPLLHCWSLAVEEQFYLFMPLAMVIVAPWLKGSWLWLTVPVLLASLAICIAMVFLGPTGGFYLLPSRAWELMAGATVAAIEANAIKGHEARAGHWLREFSALAGLALIAEAMLTLHEIDIFPGWNAIPPVLGTALLIWAGAGSTYPRINRLLSVRPMTEIGALSYSLYLVHWPIAAFFRYRFMRDPSSVEAVMAVVICLALAWLLYRFVETPFRNPRAHLRVALPLTGSILFGGLVAFALIVVAKAGLPARFPSFTLANPSAQAEWGGSHCFNEALAQPIAWDPLLCTRTQGRRHRILLWGDSFAAQYVPGLIRDAASRDSEILEYTFAGCPPIMAFSSLSRLGCSKSNARVFDLIRQTHVDVVVISARWTSVPRLTLARLHETVAGLKKIGVQVFVIGQSPEFDADVQRIDYLSGQHDAPEGQWRVSFDPSIEHTIAIEARGATFIDPLAALCHADICPYRQGGTWLFGDYGHFSAAGSLLAVRSFFPMAMRSNVEHLATAITMR